MHLPLSDAFPEAVHTLKQWLTVAPREAPCAVLCHDAPDELAAGALFGRTLPLLGFADVTVFSQEGRQRRAAPGSLVLLGRADPPSAEHVPALSLDHRASSGSPAGTHTVNTFDWAPAPPGAWLAYSLLEAAEPNVDELRELDWIAAIGMMSALDGNAPWTLLTDANRRHTLEALQAATALLRSSSPAAVLDRLLRVDGPREFIAEAARST